MPDMTPPPLPDGFTLDGAVGAGAAPPPLPDGFRLDAPPPAHSSIMTALDDLANSLDTGLARGVAGWLGGPAQMANLAAAGADHAQSFISGKPYEQVKAENDARALVPTTTVKKFGPAAVEQAMREHLPGAADILDYKPQFTAGEYMRTTGEFLPAGLANPVSAIVSALGSEAAGQLTKGSPLEPYARIAGAIATPAVAGRVVTPVRTNPDRTPFVQALKNEGVQVSAGEATGSKTLRSMESTLGNALGAGEKADALAEKTGKQFNAAAAKRMGEDADLLTGDVMQRTADRLGKQFEDLSARNTLQYDPQMGNAIAATIQKYSNQLDSLQKPLFFNLVQDVRNKIVQGNGTMPGSTYQNARSDLTAIASENANNRYGKAVAGLRDALDDAMARSISPEDAAAWKTARQQYGDMKTIETALNNGGTRGAQGYVTPIALANAAKTRNPAAYVRGQSDLGNLGKNGRAVMSPLPDSGTAGRSHNLQVATAIPSAALGAMVTGDMTGLAGGAAPFVPGLVGRVLLSDLGQRWLRNQAVAPEEASRLARLARAVSRAQLASP